MLIMLTRGGWGVENLAKCADVILERSLMPFLTASCCLKSFSFGTKFPDMKTKQGNIRHFQKRCLNPRLLLVSLFQTSTHIDRLRAIF